MRYELSFEAELFGGDAEFDELESPNFPEDRRVAENLLTGYESKCLGVDLLKRLRKGNSNPLLEGVMPWRRINGLPDLFRKMAELESARRTGAVSADDYSVKRARLLQTLDYPPEYALSDLNTELSRARCEYSMSLLKSYAPCESMIVDDPQAVSRQVAEHYMKTELGFALSHQRINSRGFGRKSWCDVFFPSGITIRVSFVNVPNTLLAVQIDPKLGPKREYSYRCGGQLGRTFMLSPAPTL